MRRILPVLFGLFLIFGLLTSVVIAQRYTPVRLAPLSDGSPTFIHALPPPQSGGSHPGDEDGDGIPDGIDQCPNQGGPSSNSGCPPGQQPIANPTPGVALPILPVNGDCVLATQGNEGVNIHIQPSTSAEIVGVLDSQTLYPVDGQHNDTAGIWDRIDEGWVARRVVRVGGNCDTLPEVYPAEGLTYTDVSLPISCDVDELINAIKNAADGSTINLAPGCIYTLTKGYPDNASGFGLPSIKIKLKINGNGATIRRSSAGGTPSFAFFYILVHDGLTLNDLTLRNGKSLSNLGPYIGGCSPCSAAAIENEGGSVVLNNASLFNNTDGSAVNNYAVGATMTVTDSTFSHNTSRVGGGAISNSMTLTISNSTFSDNSSSSGGTDSQGGAIYNGGTLTVTDSTFSSNSASGGAALNVHGDGGAIFNIFTLTISDSTFSGNTADYGGGIDNAGVAAVSNSTFYGNVAATGGGAIYNPGILTVTNSTVASNVGGGGGGGIDNSGNNLPFPASNKATIGSSIFNGNSGPDLLGSFKSLGFNVIGSTIGATLTGAQASNLTNAAASPLNLGTLASNGGSTQTALIGAGSVAIGAGNCTSMTGMTPISTDQRGSPRKPTCDIGAYES